IQLASGLLGMSAAKAAEFAQGMWTQGGDVVDDGMQAATEAGGQIAALLSPDQIRVIVREEVDKAARRLGFARDDEVASVRREVARLEQQVADLNATLHQMQVEQDEVRAERAAQQAKKAKKDAAKNSKKGKGDHS
ncbi:MAG: hypothetical protein VW239_11180, partial [Candidatus Nanopelagicales bacterium]